MANSNYSASFTVKQTPDEVFSTILNVRNWWMGVFSEEIQGNSREINDEFIFRAGGGMHYSKQKLVELIPGKKIVWLVTESELTFLSKKDEWTGTRICFEFSPKGNGTEVCFMHVGLVPQVECYEACSGGWNQYLEKFMAPLS